MEIAVLALGCFWGPEIKFSKIEGIIKTEVGYCGGNSDKTTYQEVCTGNTDHAEVVQIDFDDDILVGSVPNNQGSGNLRGMVDCNGLTFLPAGVDGIKDDFVDAIWIR